MKRILLSVSVAVAVLAVCAAAHAGKNGGTTHTGGSNGNSGTGMNNNKPVNVTPSNTNSFKQQGSTGSNSGPSTKSQQLSPKYTGKDALQKFGTKCSFGWCFKGKDQCHFTSCCWYPSYGCNCYWCPCSCVYYYFCTPDECWYPVSYCPYGCYNW